MGSTFHSLHYHVVFSTKERRPFIDAKWRKDLHAYLGGIVRGLGGVAEAVGGVEDHVHLLISLKTTDAPANIIRELKKASSVWAAENHHPGFSWQGGYAIFTVSFTHVGIVRKYIADQEEHHRKTSFAEEVQRLLERNGVAYEAEISGMIGAIGSSPISIESVYERALASSFWHPFRVRLISSLCNRGCRCARPPATV